MAYTTGALITKVQNKLDDTGFSSTKITDFLNDTQREIFNSRLFRFMETSTTFTSVAGQTLLGSLPSNFQIAIDLMITSPLNYLAKLEYVDFKVIDAIPAVISNTIPTYWYEYGGSIYVYPAPIDSSLTFTLRYYKTPTELVSSSDVPSVPEEFQELLVLGATKRALQHNDSYDQAGVLQINEFDPMLDQMTRRFGPRKQDGPYQVRLNRTRIPRSDGRP